MSRLNAIGPPSHFVDISWQSTPPGSIDVLQTLLLPTDLLHVPIFMSFHNHRETRYSIAVADEKGSSYTVEITEHEMHCDCPRGRRRFACEHQLWLADNLALYALRESGEYELFYLRHIRIAENAMIIDSQLVDTDSGEIIDGPQFTSFHILHRRSRKFHEFMSLQRQKQLLALVLGPHPLDRTDNSSHTLSKVTRALLTDYKGPLWHLPETQIWDLQFERMDRWARCALGTSRVLLDASVLCQFVPLWEQQVRRNLHYVKDNECLSPLSVKMIIESYTPVVERLNRLATDQRTSDVSNDVWRALIDVETCDMFALDVFNTLSDETSHDPRLLDQWRLTLNNLCNLFQGSHCPQAAQSARYVRKLRQLL